MNVKDEPAYWTVMECMDSGRIEGTRLRILAGAIVDGNCDF